MNIPEFFQQIEQNCDVRIFIDNDDDFDECAYYIPEVKAIGVNPNQDEQEIIESVIHEVAHHVDIVENNHPDRRDIDGEVIAHAVEEVVFWNAPVEGVIREVEGDIREAYQFEDEVKINEDDIREVADRVRIVCNYF